MIGVALVGFITILAASTKDSVVADQVDKSFRGRLRRRLRSVGPGASAPTIEDDLPRLPEVATLSPLRSATAEVDGSARPT